MSLVINLSGQDIQETLESGANYYNQGNYKAAYAEFASVLEVTNDQYFAWAGAGLCELYSGNFEVAQTKLVNSYWIENGDPIALHGLAFIEIIKNKNQTKANEMMLMAVRLWLSNDDFTNFKDAAQK